MLSMDTIGGHATIWTSLPIFHKLDIAHILFTYMEMQIGVFRTGISRRNILDITFRKVKHRSIHIPARQLHCSPLLATRTLVSSASFST